VSSCSLGSPSSTNALVESKKVNGYTICKHKRFWQVRDSGGQLICVTVYKRGAKEVVRRLSA
jgi:hypothetical protein